MKRTILLTAACAAAALAQPPANPPQRGISELKAYLNLTDAQVAGIQSVQRQAREAVGDLQQQMASRHKDLQTRLEAGGGDPAALGRLMIETAALRKQFETRRGGFREQVQALLTAEQKSKLKTLEEASRLRPAVEQAAASMLLDRPAGAIGPRGFGPPAGPGPRAVGPQAGPRRFPGPGGPGMAPRGFRPGGERRMGPAQAPPAPQFDEGPGSL